MVSKESKLARLRATLENKEGDRIPISDFFWTEFSKKACQLWGDDCDLYRKFDLDYIVINPNMDPVIKDFETLRQEGEDILLKTGFGAAVMRRADLPMPHFDDFCVKTPGEMADFVIESARDPRRLHRAGQDQINCLGDQLLGPIPCWSDRKSPSFMSILVIYGVLLISVGAFMSGSFAVPFDKVKNWKWENYWLVYCLFGYVVVPLAITALFVPGFYKVLGYMPTNTIGLVFLLGMIYGVSNITFGLSLRYLGIALGYALSLGLMMAIGTLAPPLINGQLARLFEGNGGIMLLFGILISLIGIGISGYAGFLKSKQVGSQEGVNREFNIRKGIFAALFVGVSGASVALALEQGKPIGDACVHLGANPLFRDSAVFLILYGGSFLTTFIWCIYLSIRNKTYSNFVRGTNSSLGLNYLFCALAGFLWYVNFVFFGMGRTQMGEFSFVAGVSLCP